MKLRDRTQLKGSALEKGIISSSLLTNPDPPEYDAVIISDLHLGSSICRDKHIIDFLEKLERSELRTRRLILNGDVFDSIDFRRLNKRHWKVLSLVRKLSDRMVITWVCGNHDGPADPISHILGVQVREEYEFRSGNKLVLVLHGHQFDNFIATYPTITFLADLVYRFLQAVDTTHRFARFAKSNTKVFLRCIEKIRVDSMAYAASKDVDVVCCGHTHHAETVTGGPVEYFNSGCWTESPSTFLTFQNGCVRLESFAPSPVEAAEASTRSVPLAGGVSPQELVYN